MMVLSFGGVLSHLLTVYEDPQTFIFKLQIYVSASVTVALNEIKEI